MGQLYEKLQEGKHLVFVFSPQTLFHFKQSAHTTEVFLIHSSTKNKDEVDSCRYDEIGEEEFEPILEECTYHEFNTEDEAIRFMVKMKYSRLMEEDNE